MISSTRVLIVAAVAGVVAFLTLGDNLRDRDQSDLAARSERALSPGELAEEQRVAGETIDRIRLFRTGEGEERIVLGSDEVSALLRHAVPGVIPSGVSRPTVLLTDGAVLVTARIAPASFPGSEHLGRVFEVLPDTIDVELSGVVSRLAGDRLAFQVERASAGRVPVPGGVVEAILASIRSGRADPAQTLSDPDMAMSLSVPWPEGIGSLSVVADRLVLERAEPSADRAVDGVDGA